MTRVRISVSMWILCSALPTPAWATKLTGISVLDQDYLVAEFLDGEVEHDETGTGEIIHQYTPALGTSAAVTTANWTLKSSDDSNYGTSGQHPTECSRKTKMSGQAQTTWGGGDWNYEYTYQHWIYLRLPTPMQQGSSYTLEIAAATNTDQASQTFTFDIYSSRSEAVHTNIVGYMPDAPHKAADLYHFLGEAGQRDYSSFEGRTVYLVDVATGTPTSVGTVALWKDSNAVDLPSWGPHEFIRGRVWSADFSAVNTPGTYRLAIEGVGCSDEFVIAANVYADPFRVSLLGFAYMRLGQTTPGGAAPPYRSPTLVPGVDPPDTTVYITTVQPFDGNWSSIPADQWDHPDAFTPYVKAGNPENPDAWGGHADAADLDRHLGHVSIIYDMLLPYILSRGAPSDDATGIPESGNGVPDLLDEAAFEVDFWLRLRDGAAYSHGLTNPTGSNVIYQAGTSAIAAWANAANAAMLSDAFRIAGLSTQMATYRDAAITAYTFAEGLADPMLDATLDAGGSALRGRDLKMTAAAYLYNVTGDTAYEDEVNADSVCRTSSTAEVRSNSSHDQNWATAGYLFTPQTVHYPTLQSNMRTAIIADAKNQETNYINSRPSRRASDDNDGWFPTVQNVQRTLIAHAVATVQADQDLFRKALALEADWGLGRNPMNRLMMSTWWTSLAGERSFEYMYTSGSGATTGAGSGDGVLGVHPGHTPYMNLEPWYTTVAADPSYLTATCYPAFDANWPEGEAYFNTPWVYAYSEFTPQQTMRGKTALYGYLYALGGGAGQEPTLTLTVTLSGTGSGTVTSSPAGIDCGPTCSASFASGTDLTLTAIAGASSTFVGWGGACSGTGSCSVTLTSATLVTARFDTTTPLPDGGTQADGGSAGDSSPQPGGDSGVGPSDSGTPDPGTMTDGCACSTRAGPSGLTFAGVALWALRLLRRRYGRG